jgi:hypothetical protein
VPGPRAFGDIEWQANRVAANELSGIPVSKVTEVSRIIDPLTANN